MIDEMNARHAEEHAHCTRAETVEFLATGAVVAAAAIRALSDEQLARSGTVLTDVPPMTVEQLITGGLIDHVDQHFGSIRTTVGQRLGVDTTSMVTATAPSELRRVRKLRQTNRADGVKG